jgi:DNA invertase Pin-like site-specific DNA recombinase
MDLALIFIYFESMNTMPRPKAYSYLRFSTPEQMRGDSFRRQSHMAQQWASRNGVDLDDNLTFQDLGVSAFKGANAETGMLREFQEAVRAGAIAPGSFLLIENFDRLSRDAARKAMRLLEDICEMEISVVTLSDGRVYTNESLSGDPLSFMMAFMVMIRANEESATKSRRLAQAWKEKRRLAASGTSPMTSVAPAWLRLDQARAVYDVVEDRAEVVRRMFAMTLDGVGQHQIAETFNREGIAPFGRGKYWHRSYVKKVLENPAVIGTFTPHVMDRTGTKKKRVAQSPITNYYPAVVMESVFHDVQAQRVGSLQVARQGGKHPIANVLAGLAQCPDCGSTMTRVAKGPRGGKAKLVCTRAKTGAGCRYHGVGVDDVEHALAENIGWLLAHAPAGDNDLDDQVEQARSNLAGMDEALANVLEAISNGASGPTINSRLSELEEEREALASHVASLVEQQSANTGKLVERRLADLEDALTLRPQAEWMPEDRALANSHLRQVLTAVVVNYRSGSLEMKWKHGGTSSVPFGFPMDA